MTVLNGANLHNTVFCCEKHVHQPSTRQPLIRRNSLNVDVHCDSAVCMTQKLLSSFDINAQAPQTGRQAVPE